MTRPALVVALPLFCILCAGSVMADFAPLGKSSSKSDRLARINSSPELLDCSGAVPIEMNSSVSSSTVGAPNGSSFYACSVWFESGGELMYSLSVATPTMFEIRLTADCDLDLVLLDACDHAGCLLVADRGIQTTNPVTGDFIIIVDGYDGAACDFTLEVAATDPRTIDPAACQTAANLSCDLTASFSGSNCDAEDQIRSLGCESWPAGGGERWYRLTVVPGGSFQVDLTMPDADAVLWLLGSCGEGPACLGYSDGGVTGESESVNFTNVEADNQTVFLVVDSYGAASCSSYDAVIDCNGVIVATEASSWSALKARYNRREK